MLNRKKLIIFIISILILAFAGPVSASGVGETMFVIGKSANGLTSWKTERGQSLKSLESTDAE